MKEELPLPTTPPPAARTAIALRELHGRAQAAIHAQRERMGQLEAQLTKQLDSIATTLADQCAAHESQSDQAQQSTADVEHLRAELEHTLRAFAAERDEWRAEREQLFAANVEHTRQLDERHTALDERSTSLNQQERELRERQERLDSVASQYAAQQAQLAATESALDKQREDIAGREAACQALEQQLEQHRSELETRAQACQSSEATLQAERQALEAERASLQAQQSALDVERDSLIEQRNNLAIDSQAKDSEFAAQMLSVEQQLIDERTTWDRERSNVDEQRRLLAKERDDLSTALDAARCELASAREWAAAAVERDELQQKFDLALEDMQRLRERVGELEQELASRPAPEETDSVELAQLRVERDAMAERIAELEQAPQAAEDADAAQERVDLQRRFELAVEDVRDLKKSNAQLEAKLAKLSASAGPASSSGNSSWETMKKQMLANLEGDEDDHDEDRQHERATIESTIRITDEALTHKDREIAELKQQLVESAVAPPDENAAVRQLVDADAVIAKHRARIAQIEKEMNDKLRAAEIELSIERAKLAREKVQLGDWQAEIDAHRPPSESDAAAGGSLQPKRRWLSKLGLNSDEGDS